MRWNHPTRGVVAPAEFVPLLERNGLIVPAGHWVMEKACRQVASWIAAGANDITLSVNVSPRQFAEPDFVDSVLAVLAKTRVAAQHLQLEVTEGLLLDPSSQTLAKLDALAASGIKIAVDDFGMGYSSLAYLKRFRLNALKIDRMFVHDMTRQPRDAAIVRAIIDLGHGLGLHVTAEGVETAEQFYHLRQLGCDWVQGHLIAQALSDGDMGCAAQPGPFAVVARDPLLGRSESDGAAGAGLMTAPPPFASAMRRSAAYAALADDHRLSKALVTAQLRDRCRLSATSRPSHADGNVSFRLLKLSFKPGN